MGTRLGTYTHNIPKCMVKIKNKPLITYQKYILDKINIFKNKVYVVVGYKHKLIDIEGIKKIINPFYRRTNMLFSLFYNKNFFNESLIISYGDIVYSKKIIDKLISSKSMISVVVDKNWYEYWKKRFKHPLDDAETLKINKNGYITEIGNKTKFLSEINAQYIGLIKLSKKGSKIFKNHYLKKSKFNGKSSNKAYLTDFLNDLIQDGFKVKAVNINNPWIEVDTIKDLKNPLTKTRLEKIIS